MFVHVTGVSFRVFGARLEPLSANPTRRGARCSFGDWACRPLLAQSSGMPSSGTPGFVRGTTFLIKGLEISKYSKFETLEIFKLCMCFWKVEVPR